MFKLPHGLPRAVEGIDLPFILSTDPLRAYVLLGLHFSPEYAGVMFLGNFG
jgi:hypothetical protein